jgi:hypothetical protein
VSGPKTLHHQPQVGSGPKTLICKSMTENPVARAFKDPACHGVAERSREPVEPASLPPPLSENPHPACSGAVLEEPEPVEWPASNHTQTPQAIHPLSVSRHSHPSRRSEAMTKTKTDTSAPLSGPKTQRQLRKRKHIFAVSKPNLSPKKGKLPFHPSSFRLHPSKIPLYPGFSL